MIEYLNTERIKMKASASKRILLFVPLFFLLFSIFTVLFSTQQGTFNVFLVQIFNQWPLLFLPISLAIACSSNIGLEKKSGNYKGIIANNFSLSKTWYSKIMSMASYQWLSSLFIIIVATLGSMLIYVDLPNISTIAYTTFLITLASLPLVPFNLIFAHYFGMIITVTTNLLGAIISVIWLVSNSTFWLTPWSNMLRIPAATMGIHPNGTWIEKEDPLHDPSILGLSVAVSIVYFVLLLMLSTFAFKKKVMK